MNPRSIWRPSSASDLFAALAAAQSWRYVEAADTVPPASLRLATRAAAPADLELAIEGREDGRLAFTELRFGSPGAVPIALVVHELEDRVRLYADGDRDRHVTADEELAPDGAGWSEDLFQILLDGSERRLTARRLRLLWNSRVGILEVALPGWDRRPAHLRRAQPHGSPLGR